MISAARLLLMLIILVFVAVFTLAVASAEASEFYDYSGETGNVSPIGESPPLDDNLLAYGKWLYRGLCIRCHGVEGDGQGADWKLTEFDPIHWLPRQPRDFGNAVFKLRSTPSGSLPLDKDLFESISRGLVPETDMPSFSFLAERDRWALVAYIKSFTDIWVEEAEYQEPPIAMSRPPPQTQTAIAEGKVLYKRMKCAKCHGELGIGDGPSADELTDDNNLPITPRDFTDPNQFVGPNDLAGIYRTLMTGLDGTPMPTFSDFLDDDEAWQLVYYVMSLRSEANQQE
jgi:cytochrome c oxidase cbb3-type subunit 2